MPQLSANAAQGIAAWVARGGTVVAGSNAGLLDEANRTSTDMQRLLGVQNEGLYMGGPDWYNSSVQWVRRSRPV